MVYILDENVELILNQLTRRWNSPICTKTYCYLKVDKLLRFCNLLIELESNFLLDNFCIYNVILFNQFRLTIK